MLQFDHKETHDRHMGKNNLVDDNYNDYSRSGDVYNRDGPGYEDYEYSVSGNHGITIILVPDIVVNDNLSSGDSGIHNESGFEW